MAFDPAEASEADREVRLTRVISGLERATIRGERPLRRLVRSNRLNPLPHAGTISVFLLVVVIVTGTYLTFFFEFGFEASYRAVEKLEAHPIQRVMRASHRYSSAALVVTTVVHAWRTFVMRRFTGPRRWRWVTGVLALFIVWLAGVTGYWLIWDERAQALNEATGALLGPIWPSLPVVINLPDGSGWPWLLAIWTLHLVLTGVVVWVLWRHLRNTKHRWWPPRPWMWAMVGALLVASIVFPIGMLPPADPSVAASSIPLDPFVMFFLPPLLTPWRWAAVVVGAGVGLIVGRLPWFLHRSGSPVARVVEEKCTGCELCVVDCPYNALQMSGDADGAVAVVDEARCVGCGICFGSCAFDAIGGLGEDPMRTVSPSGPVVLMCSRQRQFAESIAGIDLVSVRCTGMLNPRAVGSLVERGADSVQVVGCPPGDCVYGTGNLITSERIGGTRNPLVPRRWASGVAQDWTSPDDIRAALDSPGTHPSADASVLPAGWRRAIPAALVVLGSVAVIGVATDAPFAASAEGPIVRVVVDHVPGNALDGSEGIPDTGPMSIHVEVDGITAAERALPDGVRIREVVDLPIAAGASRVSVRFVEGTVSTVLFDGPAELSAGERLIVAAVDAPPPPDVGLGRELFEGAGLGANLGCEICHSVRAGQDGLGPSLSAVGGVAGSRVPGLTSEEYLRQSILDPDAFVVDGYRPGQMLPVYAERLTEDEIEALVTYLLTLRGDG